MGIVFKLGSFPNSQIKPRSPVRQSEMKNVALLADTETQILTAENSRVKAIIKNSGEVPVELDYIAGLGNVFTLPPGGSLTIDGGGDDVFAEAIGGAGALEIDDRFG